MQTPTIDLLARASKLAGMSPVTSPTPNANDMAHHVAKALNFKTDVGFCALQLAIENAQTLDRKQQDYGPKNISKHGITGVLVRMDDKLSRIENLLAKKDNTAQCESLEDSFLDLSNYSLICVLLLRNQWPRT